MKTLRIGLSVIALSLSLSVHAKSWADNLIGAVVDKVVNTINTAKPVADSQPVNRGTTNNIETVGEFYTPYKYPCSYESDGAKTRVEFVCLGKRTNKNLDEIIINTKEPIKLSAYDNESYQTMLAKQTEFGDWQISVLTKNGYEARFSFLNATGGGAGAPEELTFNNGNVDHLLTINLLDPLGE